METESEVCNTFSSIEMATEIEFYFLYLKSVIWTVVWYYNCEKKKMNEWIILGTDCLWKFSRIVFRRL